MEDLDLLGAEYLGAKPKRPSDDDEDEWTVTRVLKYGLGGIAGALVIGWGIKHRDNLIVETQVTGRQIAKTTRGVLEGLRAGAGRSALRESVTKERQVAARAQRVRKLERQLVQAGRAAEEAREVAQKRALALRALKEAA
jgi:hypothetical protein